MLTHDSRLQDRLRAAKVTRSDNSFANARNLGVLRPSTRPVTFRASGVVDRSDRADFYKFTIAPGANYPSVISNFNIKGASVRLTGFVQVGNRRLPQVGPQIIPVGNLTLPSNNQGGATNPTQAPLTAYLRVERVGQARSQYSLRLTYQP